MRPANNPLFFPPQKGLLAFNNSIRGQDSFFSGNTSVRGNHLRRGMTSRRRDHDRQPPVRLFFIIIHSRVDLCDGDFAARPDGFA